MRRYIPIIGLFACVAIFLFGLVELFQLRFEGGDVYPSYSSLRADPLGTMAFYESLGKIPGLSVRRDFSDSNQLPDDPGTVYLHLAARSYDWKWVPDDLFQDVKNFLARGGRLVIAFYPQTTSAREFYFNDDTNRTNMVKSVTGAKRSTVKPMRKHVPGEGDFSETDLEKEWGFHKSFNDLPQEEDTYQPVNVKNTSDLSLPDELSWHSGMVFTNCDYEWRAVYSRGHDPVVIERKFGQGSVVMASDSYFLSNEAMEGDRHAEFLAWLVGGSRNVVFDEAHLGIVEAPGIAGLMRKYHLHGLAAALLVLAGLFIWKNTVSLVPPQAGEKRQDFVTGKDSATAFVNLLRRSVAPGDLLSVCFAEWKKGVAPGGRIPASRIQQAEVIFQAENSKPSRERNSADSYRKISKALGNRTTKL